MTKNTMKSIHGVKSFRFIIAGAVLLSLRNSFVKSQDFPTFALRPDVRDPECIPLETAQNVVVGEVCAMTAADYLEVNVNVTVDACVMLETHLCNVPTKVFEPDTQTKLSTYVVMIDDTYDFVCGPDSLTGDDFIVAGHATLDCDPPFEETTLAAYYEFALRCVPIPRNAETMIRFNKIIFKNETLAAKHADHGPLMSGDYPISGDNEGLIELLRDSYAISFRTWNKTVTPKQVWHTDHIPRYDPPQSDLPQVLMALNLYEGPSYPDYPSARNEEFWTDFNFVLETQIMRRTCGDTKIASELWSTPGTWANLTVNDAAEAVHDEYPGFWPAVYIGTLFGGGMSTPPFPSFKPEYQVDHNIIPKRSRTEFVYGVIMLAEINTWAVSMVGNNNFATKWSYARPRPEEIAWGIKTGRITTAMDGVPPSVIDKIMALTDFNSLYDFTAYPEGCPAHPSWPAMHSAASALSLCLAVVMDMTPEQHEEVKRVDYAISFARTLAGVHYVTDNIDGLRIGQELVANELPAYLQQMYNSDPDKVRAKIAEVKFDWRLYDHTQGSTISIDCT